MVTCQLPRGCYGVQCCLDLTFTLPLGDMVTSKNFSFWFIVDPCDFSIDIGLGDLTLLKSTFLNYDFGMEIIIQIQCSVVCITAINVNKILYDTGTCKCRMFSIAYIM